jgi:predicted methyltransferase
MRPSIALLLTLALPHASCSKDAPSSTPPASEPAVTPTSEPAETEAVAETPAPAEDPEAKKRAEEQAKMDARMKEMEADAAKKAERYTPELRAKVAELNATEWKNTKAALAKILASEHRAPGNAERDKWRHPKETLALFGVTPKSTVFEVGQGAGWYTEILAPLLAAQGKLRLAGYDSESSDPKVRFNAKATELFMQANGNLYENVEWVTQGGPQDPVNMGPEGSVDVVLVIRMMHNIHRSGAWDRLLPAAHAALKPGGVLGVVQHRAAADADPDASAATGYLPEKWLIEKIEGYGFKLAKKSEVNANKKDTKDHEGGVWALPPVLQHGDKDKDKYLAIGESDRSTLKFVKVAPKKEKPAKADAAAKKDASAEKKDAAAKKEPAAKKDAAVEKEPAAKKEPAVEKDPAKDAAPKGVAAPKK